MATFKIVNGVLKRVDINQQIAAAGGVQTRFTGTLGTITKSPSRPKRTSTPQKITSGGDAPRIAAPVVPTISAGSNVQQAIEAQAAQNAPVVSFTGANNVAQFETPTVAFTGAPALESPTSTAGVSPVAFTALQQAIANLPAGQPSFGLQGALPSLFAPVIEANNFAVFNPFAGTGPGATFQQPTGESIPAGGGFAGNLTDPASRDALRTMAGVGAVKTFAAIEAGNAPAWITDAQVQSWIDIFGFEGSVEDIALSLGYRFNPDTGLWERLDEIKVGGSSGGRSSAGTARVPTRSTRGSGSAGTSRPFVNSMGLTNWNI